MTNFKYLEGFRAPSGLPADVVAAELDRISRECDGITATVVVEAARPETAPLHPAFEWNDGIAAEKFRQSQARQLIRAVVRIEPPQMERREYVLTKEGDSQKYLPASFVVEKVDLYDFAFGRLKAELKSAVDSLVEFEQYAQMGKKKKAGQALVLLKKAQALIEEI